MGWGRWGVCAAVAGLFLGLAACDRGPKPGKVLDEAKTVGREAASFPHSAVDYFHEMDNGLALNEREVQGRNMWIVWTGGNDRFWDQMTEKTFGAFDLLKIITSYPQQAFHRGNRWANLGLVNEPCFEEAKAPDPQRFGLYLDVRTEGCAPDPFADEAVYPGVKLGFRGKAFSPDTRFANGERPPAAMPVGSYYGYPHRDRRPAAVSRTPPSTTRRRRKWDPKRYYEDPGYYNDPKLVRPLPGRHVLRLLPRGPEPDRPAGRSGEPEIRRTQLDGRRPVHVGRSPVRARRQCAQLHVPARPHLSPRRDDTSLVSTDMINNPRTMNAIYSLGDRLGLAATDKLPGGARYLGREMIKGPERNNKQFNSYVSDGPLLGLLHRARQGADAARAEGRLGLGGRARRAQSGLPEHRPLLGRVVPALQPGGRRQDHHADPDRHGAEELHVLAGDRGRNAEHRPVLPQGGTSRPPRRRARRRGASGRRPRDPWRVANRPSPTPARAAIPASFRPPRSPS